MKSIARSISHTGIKQSQATCDKKSANGKRMWANKTPQEKLAHLQKSIKSPEAVKKSAKKTVSLIR